MVRPKTVVGRLVTLIWKRALARRLKRQCYDNAFIESFWSTLQSDTGLDTSTALSRAAAELAVFAYIETVYNPTRHHRSLGRLLLVAFENNNG